MVRPETPADYSLERPVPLREAGHGTLDQRIHEQQRANEASRQLEMIPEIGIIGARAIEATSIDPAVFRSVRDFAAWIGVNSGDGAVPHATSLEIIEK